MKVLVAGLDEISCEFLNRNGIVTEAADIQDAEDLDSWTVDGLYQAIVLNLESTGLGVFAARTLRQKKLNTPLIGISQGPPDGRSWGDHVAMFLENGGDYLLRGPVSLRELVASLRSATRRFNGALLDIVELQHGDAKLKINQTALSVTVNGLEPELTGGEMLLLFILGGAPGRTFSVEALMEQIYMAGVDDEPDPKIIDVRICKIRAKLADIHPDAKLLIETVWGRGYRLAADAVSTEKVAS